MSPLTIVLYS